MTIRDIWDFMNNNQGAGRFPCCFPGNYTKNILCGLHGIFPYDSLDFKDFPVAPVLHIEERIQDQQGFDLNIGKEMPGTEADLSALL